MRMHGTWGRIIPIYGLTSETKKESKNSNMITITDISYDDDDQELTAVIRSGGRPKAIIDILGDDLSDKEDRSEALLAEAERMGYVGSVIEDSSPASILAKKQWKNVSAEDRSREMSRRRKKGLEKRR